MTGKFNNTLAALMITLIIFTSCGNEKTEMNEIITDDVTASLTVTDSSTSATATGTDSVNSSADAVQRFFVSSYRKSGMSDDEVIEACFEDAKTASVCEIVFDEPEYFISRSVLIPSNTTVILDGCTVKQKDGTFDTAFRGDNLELNPEDEAGFPLSVSKLENVKLLGKNGAAVCGPDNNAEGYHTVLNETQKKLGDFWGWRTLTVSFSKCNGIEIGGISFKQTRCWCISLDMCENGYLHDIRVDSNVKNGDGIDLRSGCHHFLLENISGATSDDNIACTALFKNGTEKTYPSGNYLYPMEPSKNTVSRDAWDRDISDVTIRNCKVGGKHHGIICLAANGCHVYDIRIENIDECETGPWTNPYYEATVKIYTGYGSGYTAGDIHDITVRNVTSRYATYPVLCNAQVNNVKLEGISSVSGRSMKIDYPEGFEITD